jgi:hypothetical protein
MVVRDLRVYSQSLGGQVMHFRDDGGLEVDAIVTTGDAWAAFEVKLGGEAGIADAAGNLLRFAKQIDAAKSGKPPALAVITGTGYGYSREDGVQVIPIGALGP